MACLAHEVASPPLEVAVSRRIPSLDGIRGLAILLVLSWHGLFGWFRPVNHPVLDQAVRLGRLTWSGVDLFFVLSGFLIGGILLDAANSERYFATFYLRRAYRILPLYFILLLGVLCFHYVPIAYYGTFLQNFWMAKQGSLEPSILGVTWSLAVEEQFYLTLPAVIRYVSRSRLWFMVAGMILGAPVLRFFVLPHSTLAAAILMPCRADALGFGLLAALLVRTPKLWSAIAERRSWLYALLGLAFLPIAILLGSGFESLTTRFFGLEYTALAAFYCLLLLSVLQSKILGSVFSWRGLTYTGTIAYGLYLLHFPCIALVKEFTHLSLRSIAVRDPGWIYLPECVVGLVLAFLVAQISWQCLEKPLIRHGHRYRY